jgi:hypothetical protein
MEGVVAGEQQAHVEEEEEGRCSSTCWGREESDGSDTEGDSEDCDEARSGFAGDEEEEEDGNARADVYAAPVDDEETPIPRDEL